MDHLKFIGITMPMILAQCPCEMLWDERAQSADLHVLRITFELLYKVNSPTWNCKWQGQVVQGLSTTAENKWKASSHILKPSGTDGVNMLRGKQWCAVGEKAAFYVLLKNEERYRLVPNLLLFSRSCYDFVCHLLVLGCPLDLNMLYCKWAINTNTKRKESIWKAVISLQRILDGSGKGSVWRRSDLFTCF